MPKLKPGAYPSYRCHASGQGIVTLSGRDHLLGPHGTPESHTAYERKIAEWLANGRQAPLAKASDLLVLEVADRFLSHVKTYYVEPVNAPDGTPMLNDAQQPVMQPTTEQGNIRSALKPLLRLYGDTPAAEFSPLALKALRDAMGRSSRELDKTTGQTIERPGWCRSHINRQINRIKLMFAWATENELVPGSVYHSLTAVKSLRKGRSQVREAPKVKPVPEADVRAILDLLPKQVRVMLELQSLTGARSSEICLMRTREIDTTGKTWLLRPTKHKTAHLDKERVIALGPQAREVVKPWMRTDLNAYLFSPAEAEAERREKLRENRKTKVQPSQVQRALDAKRRKNKRMLSDHYDRTSYRRAIMRAIEKAEKLAHEQNPDVPADERIVQKWTPHRVRHAVATERRKVYGLEGSRVSLGHSTTSMTELYAERDIAFAQEIAEQLG